jgi:hypothetical protein
MADLAGVLGFERELEQAGLDCVEISNFEAAYQALVTNAKNHVLAKRIEDQVREYFSSLTLPAHATHYDRLLLSLRPKDCIATFNWDPLLVQAYKRNRHLGELPHVVFLHGNVGIGICNEHRNKGFLGECCNKCKRPFDQVPLLYPIGQKDYNRDSFISGEWAELKMVLDLAYMLTIWGYAAPASDVAAKEIMLAAWKQNPSQEFAEVDIIDIKPEEELERTWRPFFVRTHYGINRTLHSLFQHARRSCDHFAMATLQLAPCHNTPLPDTDDLAALQQWAKGMITEEIALRERRVPFPC